MPAYSFKHTRTRVKQVNDVFKSLGATTRSAFINANLQGINISCVFEVPRNAIKQLVLTTGKTGSEVSAHLTNHFRQLTGVESIELEYSPNYSNPSGPVELYVTHCISRQSALTEHAKIVKAAKLREEANTLRRRLLGLHRTFNSLRGSPLRGITISIGHVEFKPMKLCVRQRNIYEVTSDAALSLQRSLYQMSLAQRIGRVYSPFKVSERKGKTTGRFVAPQEIPGRFTIIKVPSQKAKVKVIEELRIPVDSHSELYAAAKQLAKKEEQYREISDKLRTLGLTM